MLTISSYSQNSYLLYLDKLDFVVITLENIKISKLELTSDRKDWKELTLIKGIRGSINR